MSLRLLTFIELIFFFLFHAPANSQDTMQQITGSIFQYSVKKGDYLIKVGARFGVDAAVLSQKNGLNFETLITPGQTLVIDNRHIVPEIQKNGILINIPQRMLYYFHNWNLIGAYPVGLGKPNWPTPTGPFIVINKSTHKTWLVPKSIQDEMKREGLIVKTKVPFGPDNPLGKYWIGISLGSIGIHSTIAPSSIYHFQSHGCIRLHSDDIEILFNHINYGSTGKIIYTPLILEESEGRIFLEVHRDIYSKGNVSINALLKKAQDDLIADLIDWKLAAKVLKTHDGIAHDITIQN